nr:DUF4011 domain-containing protein [Methylobacterium sp. OTU13CASTA1]
MSRPHRQASIEVLEQTFEGSPNAKALKSLHAELRHRKTQRAAALLRKVEKAIAEGCAPALRKPDTGAVATSVENGPEAPDTSESKPFLGEIRTVEQRSPHARQAEVMYSGAMPRAPQGIREETMPMTGEDEQPQGAYERLRERLLDMTLRNPMLSYKHRPTSKRQLQIIDEVPEEVFRLLTSDASLTVVPLPEPDDIPADEKADEFVSSLSYAKSTEPDYLRILREIDETEPDDAEAVMAKAERALRDRVRDRLGMAPVDRSKAVDPVQHARSLGIDPSFELAPEAGHHGHTDRQLQTLKFQKSLDAILEKLRNDARLAEQETGLSTLFLVFGFLEWSEQEGGKKLLAPLLLLPVHLEARRSDLGKITYDLTATTTIPEDNLSLRKRVDKDFGVQLPDVSPDIDSGFSVEAYLAEVQARVAHMRGWRVRRLLTVGHFVFGRFAMYADLDPARWPTHPVETDLVGAVMRGGEGGDGPLFGIREDHPIDDPVVAAKAPFLIHDADASQHSALVDAMDGKHLVIQGPPGTGKSQTITNLIANAMAAGKTVLFLAEKQAALEVVKRRLDVAGLGEFCLELHSDKASPKSVAEHLKNRVALGVGLSAPNRQRNDSALAQAREEVTGYVTALHREAPDGMKPFDLIWKSVRAQGDAPGALDAFAGLDLPQAQAERFHEIEPARAALALFADVATMFGTGHGRPADSPWIRIQIGEHVGPGMASALIEELHRLRARANEAALYLEGAADLGVTELARIESVSDALARLALTVPSATVLNVLRKQSPEVIASYVTDIGRERELTAAAAEKPLPHDMDDAQISAAEALAEVVMHDVRSPKLILEEASKTRDVTAALSSALDRAEPFLHALGVRTDASCEVLDALIVASDEIGKVPAGERSWFSWSPAGDFAAAHETWRKIVEAEGAWRTRFPGAPAVWPGSGQLRAVAGILRQGFLSRLFSGRRREAIPSTANQLGLVTLSPSDASILEELAVHVEALNAFTSLVGGRQVMGSHWAGLDTPFEAAASGLKLRNDALARIRARRGGDAVAERIALLGADEIARAVEMGSSLNDLRRLPEDLLTSRSGPIWQVRQELSVSVERAARILAADPDRTLRTRDEPLPDLLQAIQVERDGRTVWKAVTANPLHAELGTSGNDILPKLRAASEWLRIVLEEKALDHVRERMLGETAEVTLDALQEVVGRGRDIAVRLDQARHSLRTEYAIDAFDHVAPAALRSHLDGLLPYSAQLGDLIDLKCQRRDIAALGLDAFVRRAEETGVAPAGLPALFDNLLARRRAESLRRRDPVLMQAAGNRLDARRRSFVEADRRKVDNDRVTIRDRLLTRGVLAGNGSGPRGTWTEGPLLDNEMKKQKRHVPVRELMRRASASLLALSPCFMMSPLSLAKFLPRGKVRFDLLIIDEASQMRPEDALGGLLRVGQIVVVGDQKQLPPSQFFNRAGGSDATVVDDEMVEDLDDESILESCAKTFREARMLKWHYRSRCESLIAFSNKEFYGNDLITFPTAHPSSFSVDLVSLPGRYDAGRNPMEAQAVAEESIIFMRRHAEEAEPPSLGVVSVNSDQRDLIEEEIQRLSADDELVLIYQEKVGGRGEPFFVKNLENVQGDERDYILISMTYGPATPGGPVAQRFGPIAGKHGHRRLNVLFTRARLRIIMFASFGSKDVRPTPTSAEGVHILKRYFEYAERRGYAEVKSDAQADSDFEVEVARRLKALSLQIDHQVGVSGFRIDIGVRHPDHPERFIAGIECDGARYHSSKSARDRDRLREEILTGLGWTILRVWSTDWFDNPDLQTRILASRIEELRSRELPRSREYRVAAVMPLVAPIEEADVDLTEAVTEQPSLEEMFGLQPDSDQSQPIMPAIPVQDDGARLLSGTGQLSREQLLTALRSFRDTVIAPRSPSWEPQRSLLRESMIEMLVAQRLDDPADWFKKVPGFQRSGTDAGEKRLFLEPVCDLVARLNDQVGVRSLA